MSDKILTVNLPEVNIYPNNRFGDIARKLGLKTARNWRKVREGTTKGINDFISSPLALFVQMALPLPLGLEGVGEGVKLVKKLGKIGNKWIKARLINSNMKVNPENITKVNNSFRNKEWSNFLSTRNGDNYYRMAKSNKIPNTTIEGEKLFLSHTTPWEEFTGLGTSNPIGTKTLYEFPTKTFGVKKASDSKGILGDMDVTEMGKNHLRFGNTSSGNRDKVLLLSELDAKIIEMDPYTIGIKDRPTTKKGFYNTNPEYENIHYGNLTVVTSLELKNAILNSKYNLFEYSPNGIIKKLYIP